MGLHNETVVALVGQPESQERLRQALSHLPGGYDVFVCASLDAALLALAQAGERLVLVCAEHITCSLDGIALLQRAREQQPLAMRVLVGETIDAAELERAINNAQVHRYLRGLWHERDPGARLGALVSRPCRPDQGDKDAFVAQLRQENEQLRERVKQRAAELAEANRRLSDLSTTDALTQLYNHRYFHARLSLEAERSGRTDLPLSLLLVDVDNFGAFNDRYGQMSGDAALRKLGEILSEGRRLNDVVARYGPEELAILLPDTPREAAAKVAERVRRQVSATDFRTTEPVANQPSAEGGADSRVALTVSIGISSCPEDAEDPGHLLLVADAALYRAKTGGRDRVELSNERDRKLALKEAGA